MGFKRSFNLGKMELSIGEFRRNVGNSTLPKHLFIIGHIEWKHQCVEAIRLEMAFQTHIGCCINAIQLKRIRQQQSAVLYVVKFNPSIFGCIFI